MFGSAILDVAVGLVFIYLLLSLTATAAQEALASALRRRARTLRYGIANLLRDPTALEKVYQHPLVRSLAHRETLLP
jgi:predicted lysophospholipase L1 biosynthesis ABC-type transport system permease subunit